MTPSIRPAAHEDFGAIQAIYAHHVLTSTATFETEAPTIEEMHRRWSELTSRHFPYLVAACDGQIAGYAYVSPYRPRPAYRFTVEDSIYLHPAFQGKGIGKRLLGAVIEAAVRQHYRQMIAVIGGSSNVASIRLHESLGFELTGTLIRVGYKFDQWIDTVLMQRNLTNR